MEDTTKNCPCNDPSEMDFGCKQLPDAATNTNANATRSCHSFPVFQPQEAAADNTLQVFGLRTKGLFNGC